MTWKKGGETSDDWGAMFRRRDWPCSGQAYHRCGLILFYVLRLICCRVLCGFMDILRGKSNEVRCVAVKGADGV